MEKDDEVSGLGNNYTADFWQYDPRLGRRWNMDPKSIVGLSQYVCFAGNPLLYSDKNGDIIDPSLLTPEAKQKYDVMIKALSESEVFRTYYEHLQASATVYQIVYNPNQSKGGQFSAANNKVSLKSLTEGGAVLAQELFHAYQKDLNVYDYNKDHAVIETEGDIATQYVANESEIGLSGFLAEQAETWAKDVLGEGGNQFVNPTNKVIQSAEYDKKFMASVDKRILFFKKKNNDAYIGYTAFPNSGQKPLALKKLFEEIAKKREVNEKTGTSAETNTVTNTKEQEN